MRTNIKKILIAGGGTAGWISAATLSSALKGACEITLVESETIGTIGVGEATIPPIKTLNAMLGLDEQTFLRETQGTFKLGIEFVNWLEEGQSYFHPFGSHGRPFDLTAVHQHWLRLFKTDKINPFHEMSMAWQLSTKNKFTHPVGNPKDVLSTFEYAYHFDAGLYAKLLRIQAEKRGVRRIEGKIQSVELDGESGFVRSIALEGGLIHEADFFIDCTGFRGVLIDGALKEPFEDWSQWLVCDRAVTLGSEPQEELPPFTRSTAHKDGWQWRIPLQHRTGNGRIYSTQFSDEKSVTEEFVNEMNSTALGDPSYLKFRTGVRRNQWVRNVVTVGLSSGFLEPLESTSIHMIQANVSKILAYFPDIEFDPAGIQEFNHVARLETERIRDFLILHYKLNNRFGDPLWDYCRNMDIPDTLALKIEHFKKFGRHIPRDKDIFGLDSWLAVHIGQGNIPEKEDPILALHDESAEKWFTQFQSIMKMKARESKTHKEFVETYCAATVPD